MSLVSEEKTVQQFRDDFNNTSIRYGDMKKQLADDMVKFISPIRKKAEAIYNDKDYLKRVMQEGAEKARSSATKTIERTRELMYLNYLR